MLEAKGLRGSELRYGSRGCTSDMLAKHIIAGDKLGMHTLAMDKHTRHIYTLMVNLQKTHMRRGHFSDSHTCKAHVCEAYSCEHMIF